jgi:hypothetical protein
MSKDLLLLLLGAFVSWLLISFLTRDYDMKDLFAFTVWASIGYQAGKKEK